MQQRHRAEVEPYLPGRATARRSAADSNYSNDLQIDGSPIGIGYKTSYMPSPDSVQEVDVQQNAVDAEYGHSLRFRGHADDGVRASTTGMATCFIKASTPGPTRSRTACSEPSTSGRTHM